MAISKEAKRVREDACERCSTEKVWSDCYDCENGYYHECYDDVCCCLDPLADERCDTCHGIGGWMICLSCFPDVEN
jgi:hypothetical protein